MGIIWTIVVGFVVGVLAKFLHPGRDNMGFVMTTLLGIACAILAAIIGRALGIYEPGQPAGWIASIVGAVILLMIYGRMRSAPS